MTRTARRRWSREFQGEIDGIALGDTGPVILHGYDPPAGGKWIDSVIPGKLGAYERATGDVLWLSPCEVGYGRGFGCGLGEEEDVVILGPSNQSHRIARMSLATGELIGASEIGAFDQALAFGDVCLTVTPQRVTGILTSPMLDATTGPPAGALLTYYRWFSNNVGFVDDIFRVEISNNGGSSWVPLETVGATSPEAAGGWYEKTFRIADHIAPTSTMRLRFIAQDLGTGSVVEAGVDHVRIVQASCAPPRTVPAPSTPLPPGPAIPSGL